MKKIILGIALMSLINTVIGAETEGQYSSGTEEMAFWLD
ncbi:Uncharacterised protein [Helicobacter muridarum]|uniref:Uncharacterized protein n=1 Tax=Helicobacter muridarum TaxID=216 RepID=A0A377PRT7_9HELI|nr:Uncharacterised protein [Helicobacter muridarum]